MQSHQKKLSRQGEREKKGKFRRAPETILNFAANNGQRHNGELIWSPFGCGVLRHYIPWDGVI
jgi:hypothetical protein